MNTAFLLTGIFLSQFAYASGDILTLTPGTQTIANVKISTEGVAKVEDRETKLNTQGAGVRRKEIVGGLTVKAYVAQLLVSDKSQFVATEAGALESTDKQSAVAMHLTFLQNVDGATVQQGFADSLNKNAVDMNRADIKDFMTAVSGGGAATKGAVLQIVGERLQDATEVVTYYNSKTGGSPVVIKGGAGFVRAVLSIWLGEMTDEYLAELKKDLIGVN